MLLADQLQRLVARLESFAITTTIRTTRRLVDATFRVFLFSFLLPLSTLQNQIRNRWRARVGKISKADEIDTERRREESVMMRVT